MTGDEEQVVTLTSAKVGAGSPRQWLLRLSALSILFALLPLWAIGCPFGDSQEEETDQFQDRVSALRTTQANAPTKTKRIPTIPPTATPVAKTDKQARMLVWTHLSLCTAIDSRTLTAVKVKEDWFVRASDSSPGNPGIWKVDTATGALEPYDALARSWNSLVQSQCSPEILATLTTPTPMPTPTLAVGKAKDAEVVVWAYLIQCDPSLSTRQFEAKWNQLSGKWVITSDSDAEVNYGVWILRGTRGNSCPMPIRPASGLSMLSLRVAVRCWQPLLHRRRSRLLRRRSSPQVTRSFPCGLSWWGAFQISRPKLWRQSGTRPQESG